MPTKRDVLFIGICGPSGSGKSTIAKRLAAVLGSPIIPIQADWFFKTFSEFHSCPQREHCWELSTSVDSTCLAAQLQLISCKLAAADKVVPSITITTTKSCTRCLDAEGLVGSNLPSGPIYVIVEGFVLFANPQLVAILDHGIWLDMDMITGAIRRYSREGRVGPSDLTNPIFVQYVDEFYRHIFEHHAADRELQLGIIRGKLCARIDATEKPEAVAGQALAALNAALGEDKEADGQGSTESAFGNALSGGQQFVWIRPTSQIEAGGYWWLAPDGMHEIRKYGGWETAESPSFVEIVGRSNFVMWHYRHVYLLDTESGCVFVHTGKAEGITHVAQARDCRGLDDSELVRSRTIGEMAVGWHRLGVVPMDSWLGRWKWDDRGGLVGEWIFEQRGSEYVIIETKMWKGEMHTYEHRLVFITPCACLLPKFGHVYMLDPDNDRVEVWNGNGLNFGAMSCKNL